MHTFELHLSAGEVVFKEFKDGKEPVREERASLDGFLNGELHEVIMGNMNEAVLPQALESARIIQPVKRTGALRNAYLVPILKEAREFPAKLKAAAGNLSAEQLNWKPDAKTWSVGECIDHIITTNRSYFTQLEAIARGDKHVSFWEKLPLLHGFWGRFLVKATSPNSPKKAKSPPPFRPTRSTVSPTILDEFTEHQRKLIALAEGTDGVDHHETIVSSPGAGFVTYSLHDGLTILFQHETRHLNQIIALMKRPEFPKS